MAKYTKENLRKAAKNYGHTTYFEKLRGMWKKKGIIPDKYLEMQGWNCIPKKREHMVRDILTIPEINYCKLVDKRYMFTSVMAEIKFGKRHA